MLIEGFERALRLHSHKPGSLLPLADYLYGRTSGYIVCALPDILQHDVPKLDGRADGSLSRITITALSLLGVVTTGVTAAVGFGLVNLTFQPSQFIDRLRAYLSEHHKRGQVPQNLGEREAVGYVVNECYAAVKEFEQRIPGTRIGSQAARAGGLGG
jgi:hypothetical protein